MHMACHGKKPTKVYMWHKNCEHTAADDDGESPCWEQSTHDRVSTDRLVNSLDGTSDDCSASVPTAAPVRHNSISDINDCCQLGADSLNNVNYITQTLLQLLSDCAVCRPLKVENKQYLKQILFASTYSIITIVTKWCTTINNFDAND